MQGWILPEGVKSSSLGRATAARGLMTVRCRTGKVRRGFPARKSLRPAELVLGRRLPRPGRLLLDNISAGLTAHGRLAAAAPDAGTGGRASAGTVLMDAPQHWGFPVGGLYGFLAAPRADIGSPDLAAADGTGLAATPEWPRSARAHHVRRRTLRWRRRWRLQRLQLGAALVAASPWSVVFRESHSAGCCGRRRSTHGQRTLHGGTVGRAGGRRGELTLAGIVVQRKPATPPGAVRRLPP